MSRGPPKPRRSGVCWSRVYAAGSGRGTGGRSREIEVVEGTSFSSPGTQGPPPPRESPAHSLQSSGARRPRSHASLRLSRLCRALARLVSAGSPPSRPAWSPSPRASPHLPHSSWRATLQVWGSSAPLQVRPGPPPNAVYPSCFWDPAPGWSGNLLRLGSERPTAMVTAPA